MQLDDKRPAALSILCVEDDTTTRKKLHNVLTKKYPDIVVYCAKNGADGLSLFKEYRPKIIISDISMPVMDGIQMATAIRSLDPEAFIIVLTAFSDTAFLLKAIEIGIDQFILKPVDLERLFGVITNHINNISQKQEVSSQNDRIRQLSIVVEQSPSSVVITDADGKTEYVNSRFTTLTGYSPSEVIGQNASMLLSGLATIESYADLRRAISSGVIWRGELQNTNKNNQSYWVSIVVSPINYDDGTTHYVSVSEDITAHKLAEQERESTVEFLRIVNASTGIQDMISAAMLFFREKSGCSAVGIRLRDGEDYPYSVTHGFPVDFVLAEKYLCSKDTSGEVLRDDSGDAILDCMCGNIICGRFDPEKPFFTSHGSFWTNSTTELLATTGDADSQYCTLNRCNGAGFESVALIPLFAGQDRFGLLQLNDQRKGAFSPEDISHWECLVGYLAIALVKFRTEESLRKLNEELDHRVQERTTLLERSLKELEAFSYSVSHDLRAPLRHINSYLSIMSEEFGDILPTEVHGFLDRSRAASGRMGNLIDDLLELSRVGRTNLVKKTVNLSELATHASDWLFESEPHRTVEFVISDGLRARGDDPLLMQLMVNLLGNAWKYTATNPAARIEFGKEVVSGKDIFYIRDNGVGFDMAYSDKLFGAFQRLHGAEYEGNGIGLATVKRIIERHGGKVWADSKVNEGATFYFSL